MDFSYLHEILEEMRLPSMAGLGDFHLRSAIHQIDHERLATGKGRRRENQDYQEFKKEFGEDRLESGDPTEFLLWALSLRDDSFSESIRKRTHDTNLASSQVVKNRLRAESSVGDMTFLSTDGKIKIVNALAGALSTLYSVPREEFANILVRMVSMSSGRKGHNHPSAIDPTELGSSTSLQFYPIVGGLIITGREIFGISQDPQSSVRLFSCDVLRMTADKLAERDIIVRACRIGHQYNPVIYPTEEFVLSIFFWGDKILQTYGNAGYKFLKAFEALVVGNLLKSLPCVVTEGREFWDNTVMGLREDFPDDVDEFSEKLETILLRGESTHWLTQAFGLYRIWGHPTIDSRQGFAKIRRIGTAVKDISQSTADSVGREFKFLFFDGFYAKHKRYPAYVNVRGDTNYITSCLEQRSRISRRSPEYIASGWDSIEVDKTFSPPSSFNLAMIVADTAVSPSKSILKQVARKEKSLFDPFERRGVLKWLKGETIDCEQLLREVNEGVVDPDHLAIGAYGKEREINPIARMFSLMTLPLRSYIVVTENMISEDILPFFSEITMTDSLLDLTKKIYSHSHPQGDRSKVDKKGFKTTICLNMDFQKWNLNMRKESTYSVFRAMGQLYGYEHLFNRTYDLFRESYIYLSDGSWDLELNQQGELNVSSDLAYKGHLGGFEGLRQKGWTVFTICAIVMVCHRHPIEFKIMGQGDNQVLLITLRTHKVSKTGELLSEGREDMISIFNSFRKDLLATFSELSLPLNELETWSSEGFFIYGKYPVIKGVPHAMSLKKECRAFPLSNDDAMTVDNMLGAVFSNCQAAAMNDCDHLVPYTIALWEGARGLRDMIKYHPLIGSGPLSLDLDDKYNDQWTLGIDPNTKKPIRYAFNRLMSDDELVEALLLIPKSLGGTNGITEYEFVMRGFPDNQIRDYTYLLALHPVLKGITKTIACNWLIPIYNPEKKFELLIEDPGSINLLAPMTPLSSLRRFVRENVQELPELQNESVKEMFSLLKDDSRELIIYGFCMGERLYTRFLHDLYGSTLYGYVDAILSKIDKTVTAQRLTMSRQVGDIMRRVSRAERNFWRYFLWRCQKTSSDSLPSCPTNAIRKFRNESWEKEILGLGVPFPAHLLEIKNCIVPPIRGSNCTGGSYISCYQTSTSPASLNELLTTLGRSPPYLGSFTKEKIQVYGKLALYGSEPLLRRPISLLRLINWAIPEGGNNAQFILSLVRAVTDLDPIGFIASVDESTGSADHRYRDFALKHGALSSSLYTLGTWLHMTTDTLVEYAKGGSDVTLHFQSMLCWVQMVESLKLLERTAYGRSAFQMVAHAHIRCHDCILPVEGDIPELPMEDLQLLIPSLPDNKILYTRAENVDLRDLNKISPLDKIPYASVTQFQEQGMLVHRNLLEEVISERVVADILTIERSGSQNHSIAPGLMEIKSYPKVVFLKISVMGLCRKVIKRLLINEEGLLRSLDTLRTPDSKLIKGKLYKRLSRTSAGQYLGLGMTFLWKEKIPEWRELTGCHFPNHYPYTWDAVCSAAKSNILLMLTNPTFELKWEEETEFVLERYYPSLQETFLIKILGSDTSSRLWSCPSCRELLFDLNFDTLGTLSEMTSMSCVLHHKPFAHLTVPFRKLRMSQDRLEKMVAIYKEVRFRERPVFITSSLAQCSYVISSSVLMTQTVRVRETVPIGPLEGDLWYHLSRAYRIFGIPTSAQYRTVEALNLIREKIRGEQHVLVIGDGFGGSSTVIKRFLRGASVYTTTLIDSSESAPQSFHVSAPPTQVEEGLDEEIFNSLSMAYQNNVFSPKWGEVVSSVEGVSEWGLLVSEIELHQVAGQEHYTYHGLVEALRASVRARHFLIKVYLTRLSDLYDMLNSMIKGFSSWSIFVTPYCNIYKGEVWVYASFPTQQPRESFCSRRDIVLAGDRLHQCMQGKISLEPGNNYFYAINRILGSPGKLARVKNHLTSWYMQVGINPFWDNKGNLTSLFWDLRTGKKPRAMEDEYGNKQLYWRSESELLLLSRLACLTVALLKNPHKAVEFLSRCDLFRIRWSKKRNSVKTISDNKWSPYLEYDGIPKRQVKAETSKYFPLLREILHTSKFETFERVGNIVKFRYCRKKHPREVCWKISRSSSRRT